MLYLPPQDTPSPEATVDTACSAHRQHCGSALGLTQSLWPSCKKNRQYDDDEQALVSLSKHSTANVEGGKLSAERRAGETHHNRILGRAARKTGNRIMLYLPPQDTPSPEATVDTAYSAHRQHCGLALGLTQSLWPSCKKNRQYDDDEQALVSLSKHSTANVEGGKLIVERRAGETHHHRILGRAARGTDK